MTSYLYKLIEYCDIRPNFSDADFFAGIDSSIAGGTTPSTEDADANEVRQKTSESSSPDIPTQAEAAKSFASSIGNGLLYLAESPIFQALGAFSGGALPVQDREAEILNEGFQKVASFAEEQFSKTCETNIGKKSIATTKRAINKCGDIAVDLMEKASKTSPGRVVVDAASYIALTTFNAAILAGGGNLLVRIAKYFVTSTIDVEKQTNKAITDLNEITGDRHLSTLLSSLTPTLMGHIDDFVQKELTGKKLKLWKKETDFIGGVLRWVLEVGAVNLFQYMKEHPNREVEQKAVELELNPVEKLGYYLYMTLSSQLDVIEQSIKTDIEQNGFIFDKNPNKRIEQLKPRFKSLVEIPIEMAFGNTKNLSQTQRLLISVAKNCAATKLANVFDFSENAPNNKLDNLDHSQALNRLQTKVGNQDIVKLLDNSAKIIAEKLSDNIDKKITNKMLDSFPEVVEFLGKTPEWKKHFAVLLQITLLKGIAKQIEERPENKATGLAAADTIKTVLNIIVAEFDRLDHDAIELANQIKDEKLREAELNKSFKPLATRLYALFGSEIPLPFPSLTKKFIEKQLLENILPSEIAGLYNEWKEHRKIIVNAKEEIEKIAAHNHATEACKVIVAFVRDLVPHLLIDDNNSLAAVILKAAKDKLMALRVDAYIQVNETKTDEIIKQHLMEEGKSSNQADIRLFKEKHSKETRQIIIKSMESTQGQNALIPFIPSALEINSYLSANQEAIQKNIADNIKAFGESEGLRGLMSLTLPLIEATLLNSMARVHKRFKELNSLKDNEGRPEFISKLLLSWLHTTAEHMQKVNKIRAKEKAPAAHAVPLRVMVEGFGKDLHDGVPSKPEMLELQNKIKLAKIEMRTLLRRLRSAKEEKSKATTPVDIEVGEAKILLYRRDIAKIEKKIKDAEVVLDVEREKAIRRQVSGFMNFIKVNSPDDLIALPKQSREFLHPLLNEDVLPKLGLVAYKKSTDPHTIRKGLFTILKLLGESQSKGGLDKIVYTPPEDETQQQLDEVLGSVVKQLLSTLPKSVTYAALQMNGINKMTASALGGIIRQKLGKEDVLMNFLEQGLKALTSSLKPGEWKYDNEGNPIFEPAESRLSFTFPQTIEEKEDAAIRREQEETDIERELKQLFAKTTTQQMKSLIASKRNEFFESILKKMVRFLNGYVDDTPPAPGTEKLHRTHLGLWADFQAALDDHIEDHFGSFGKETKRIANTICRLFVITMLGSVLKLVCPLMYRGVFWIVEKYIEHKAQQITKVIQMDILEDLYMRLIDDFIELINAPEKSNIENLVKELKETTDDWVKEQAIFDQQEYEESHIAQVAALTNEMQRIWKEEPNHTTAIVRIANEIRTKMNTFNRNIEITATPLVGNEIPPSSLPAGDEQLTSLLRSFDEVYEAVRIKGDGHCLFRGVGLELLRLEQQRFLQNNILLNEFRDQELHEDEEEKFKNILNRLHHDPQTTPKKIMETPQDSDTIVKTLRHIANNYNKKNSKSLNVEGIARGEQNKSLEEYFADMKNMDTEHPVMGGDLELQALANVLNIKIIVHNIASATEYNTVTYNGETDAPEIELLFYSSHYNIMRKKQGNVLF